MKRTAWLKKYVAQVASAGAAPETDAERSAKPGNQQQSQVRRKRGRRWSIGGAEPDAPAVLHAEKGGRSGRFLKHVNEL